MQPSRFITLLAASALSLGVTHRGRRRRRSTARSSSAFRWRNVGPANFMGRSPTSSAFPARPRRCSSPPRAAASGRRRTTASPGARCSTTRASSRWACSRSRRRTRTSCGRAPASRTRATRSSRAPASTSRPTAASLDVHGPREDAAHRAHRQIDPRNPNVVYVAALGAAWKSSGERGLYKTTDGGTTWKLIKSSERQGGLRRRRARPVEPRRRLRCDVGALPHAVLAQVRRPRLGAVEVDRRRRDLDGDQGRADFPKGAKGRIGLAISRSNPHIVYALTEAASIAPGAGHTSSAIPRRTASIARPTPARRGRT